MNTARKERERKERNPDCFCPAPGCLWRTTDGAYCPKHAPRRIDREGRDVTDLPGLWDGSDTITKEPTQ